jgi:hypothetical protein
MVGRQKKTNRNCYSIGFYIQPEKPEKNRSVKKIKMRNTGREVKGNIIQVKTVTKEVRILSFQVFHQSSKLRRFLNCFIVIRHEL